MASLVLLANVLVVLVAAHQQPPHRTVVDLDRLKSSLEKHQLLRDTEKTNINIGLLSSFKDLGNLIAAAVPLAVDAVNADPHLLPSHHLRWVAYDSGDPNSALTIRRMTQLREEGVVAFIGPDHSCVSEALVAAAWNMPMITYKCSDSKVSNKNIFSTFARTLPPSSKVSKSLISLLKHFTWNQLVLLVSDSPSEKQIAEVLTQLSHRNGIEILETFYLPGDYLTDDNTTLKDIVLKTFAKTREVFFFFFFVPLTVVLVLRTSLNARRILKHGGRLSNRRNKHLRISPRGTSSLYTSLRRRLKQREKIIKNSFKFVLSP